MDASVQKQIRDQHDTLVRKSGDRNTPRPELAAANGDLGRLLMAADFSDAAEAAFLNAQALAPEDYRWPYYLAHLMRKKGDLPKATSHFERALQLKPDDVATLVWVGEGFLAQGRPADAEPMFSKALSLQPSSLSARFGLGRTALAKQEYARAVEYLEEILARDPGAAGAHYPLALAYQGLGKSDKADAHLKQRQEHDILPADPLMVELEELLQSPQTYERLGIRALDREDWPAAAAQFRKGLELDPKHASLRHRLGTALYMMGDARGAREQFEQSLQASPSLARAHYSLGVLAAAEGRHAEAIERFSAAVRYDPNYGDARLRLAASLRRTGRPGESLEQYTQVLAANPASTDARFGQALALVQLRRYVQARDRFSDAMKAYPDQVIFAHGLARLLAAAPDDRVRDGQRALALVEALLEKTQRTPDLGETMAMALAEVGRYAEAARIQRDLIAGGERAGRQDIVRRLARNLELYERREPCRTPWTEDEML
jgi:tetratricopeptide (TPR) repeat protein